MWCFAYPSCVGMFPSGQSEVLMEWSADLIHLSCWGHLLSNVLSELPDCRFSRVWWESRSYCSCGSFCVCFDVVRRRVLRLLEWFCPSMRVREVCSWVEKRSCVALAFASSVICGCLRGRLAWFLKVFRIFCSSSPPPGSRSVSCIVLPSPMSVMVRSSRRCLPAYVWHCCCVAGIRVIFPINCLS